MSEYKHIPHLPMLASGLPDAKAAANSHTDGYLTTLQTVQIANEIAHLRSMDAPIRALASSIVGDLTHAKRDVPIRIARWIRENVKYTQETPLVEILQGPYRTLGNNIKVETPMGPFQFSGTGTGDCDDLSILFATLCRSVGIEGYLAGIAKYNRPEGFFHAMGYAEGLFYELSLDAPYGGVGGGTIASPRPYPDIVATVYDPARKTRKQIKWKPDGGAVMAGTATSGTQGSDCGCGTCSTCSGSVGPMRGFDGDNLSAPLYTPTSRPPSEQIPPLIPSPNGVMPVDSLQPHYTVPFNLYAPTRQISGISMNGSRGSLGGGEINRSPLMSITGAGGNNTPSDNYGTQIIGGMGSAYSPPPPPPNATPEQIAEYQRQSAAMTEYYARENERNRQQAADPVWQAQQRDEQAQRYAREMRQPIQPPPPNSSPNVIAYYHQRIAAQRDYFARRGNPQPQPIPIAPTVGRDAARYEPVGMNDGYGYMPLVFDPIVYPDGTLRLRLIVPFDDVMHQPSNLNVALTELGKLLAGELVTLSASDEEYGTDRAFEVLLIRTPIGKNRRALADATLTSMRFNPLSRSVVFDAGGISPPVFDPNAPLRFVKSRGGDYKNAETQRINFSVTPSALENSGLLHRFVPQFESLSLPQRRACLENMLQQILGQQQSLNDNKASLVRDSKGYLVSSPIKPPVVTAPVAPIVPVVPVVTAPVAPVEQKGSPLLTAALIGAGLYLVTKN